MIGICLLLNKDTADNLGMRYSNVVTIHLSMKVLRHCCRGDKNGTGVKAESCFGLHVARMGIYVHFSAIATSIVASGVFSGDVGCRNRKDNGNPTLIAQIARQFNVPAAMAPPGGNQAFQFNQFIYLTQACNALHACLLSHSHLVLLLSTSLCRPIAAMMS